MAKMLVIYNGTNKRLRRDGDEFKREAKAWAEAQETRPLDPNATVNPLPPQLVDVRDGRIRAEIRQMTNGLDVLAIFDHGTPKGLPRLRESYRNVKGLAKTIANVTNKITIILYACSCGRGWWWRKWWNKKDGSISRLYHDPRDGYAMALAAELDALGVDATIYAHLTAGHTTRNPHLVKVHKVGGQGLPVRTRMAKPGTPNWRHWVADLKTDYRFTFWYDILRATLIDGGNFEK